MNNCFSLENKTPDIGQRCFIAPGAMVGGDIKIGNDSSIWFNSVARGDVGKIIIGERTNIQDLCMLHITDDLPLKIGNEVSVGHSVTLHSCTIEDNCLIGMGATVLDNAVIGKNSLVAAGALVTPGKVFPPNSKIVGSPARVARELTADEIEQFGQHYKSYIIAKDYYLNDKEFKNFK